MNLASRPAPTAGGNAHSVHPAVAPNVVSGSNAAACNQAQNQNPLPNKAVGNNLMNLFTGNLTVPREMLVQARGAQNNQHVMISLNFVGTIGQGTFGQIERASLNVHSDPNGESKFSKSGENFPLQVAVKRVLQDPRYKNRELSIMQRLNVHPNVVRFYYYYYSTTPSSNRSHRGSSGRSGSSSSGFDLFLHLVLECFPESLCELIYRYVQRDAKLPTHMIKIFTYQMLKALAYLHSHQICHRDIKSSNLLVDESTLVLKVCDFGSAKEMVPGAANVSYISSRYYRAPELLFGAQLYTCAIDTWSGGCVLAEMLRQRCLFMGIDSVDQLVKIIRVLGTPSLDDIDSMNPMYRTYNFPKVLPCPVSLFFPKHTPSDLLNLMQTMLVFNPALRVSPLDALLHPCFNELRELGPNGLLPGRIRLPPHLFDPNPDPAYSVASPSEPSVPAAGLSNNWTQPDVSNWHGLPVNRKSSDVSTDERKVVKKGVGGPCKPNETDGDWSNRVRPLDGSDKTSSMPPDESLAADCSVSKAVETSVMKKPSSRRVDDRRLPSDHERSGGIGMNNGASDARNTTGLSPGTLNQSFKFGLVSGTTATSETPEVDPLTAELSG